MADVKPATVGTQQYDAGEGWDVGQRAPADRYGTVNPDGTVDVGGDPGQGGYGRLIVAKGDTITQQIKDQLEPKQTSGTSVSEAPAPAPTDTATTPTKSSKSTT
jgi:hypothetical protein